MLDSTELITDYDGASLHAGEGERPLVERGVAIYQTVESLVIRAGTFVKTFIIENPISSLYCGAFSVIFGIFIPELPAWIMVPVGCLVLGVVFHHWRTDPFGEQTTEDPEDSTTTPVVPVDQPPRYESLPDLSKIPPPTYDDSYITETLQSPPSYSDAVSIEVPLCPVHHYQPGTCLQETRRILSTRAQQSSSVEVTPPSNADNCGTDTEALLSS